MHRIIYEQVNNGLYSPWPNWHGAFEYIQLYTRYSRARVYPTLASLSLKFGLLCTAVRGRYKITCLHMYMCMLVAAHAHVHDMHMLHVIYMFLHVVDVHVHVPYGSALCTMRYVYGLEFSEYETNIYR